MRFPVPTAGYLLALNVLFFLSAPAQKTVSGASGPRGKTAASSPAASSPAASGPGGKLAASGQEVRPEPSTPEEAYRDSLERLLAAAPDSAKPKVLFALDNAYLSVDPTKSLGYERQRLAIAERLGHPHDQAAALISMSRAALLKNEVDSAKTWLQKAYTLAEKHGENRLMALALLNQGAVCQGSSNNAAGLDYYFRAVRITKAIKDTPLTNLLNGNIGIIYSSEADYTKAEEYTLQVVPMIDSTRGDPQVYPKTMEELGVIYVQKGKIDLARHYFQIALRLYGKQNDEQGLATIYSHFVAIFDPKRPDSALYFALKAKEIWDRINPNYFMAGQNIANIGTLYYELATDSTQPLRKDKAALLRKAEEYLTVALADGLKTHRAEELISYYNQLAAIQDRLQEYKPAYDNVVKGAKLNDSLYSQEEKNKLASLDEKYQVQLREEQLAANRHTLAVQARQKYYLLAGIFLLVVIGALLYRQSRTRKRLNNKLITLNQQLDEANEVKTRFVGMLNHDLRAPVANLINILHLQKEGADIMDENTAAVHAERIKGQAETLLTTMEDILSWSKGQMKNFQPQRTQLSVHELFTDIDNHFSGTPHVLLRFAAPEGMTVDTDEYYLKTILRNLTGNAIKSVANKPGGMIEWTAGKENGKTVLTIADNGPGITEDQLKPLYDESMPSTLRAGLGLHLVRDLSRTIGCTIVVATKPGRGTEFRLFL